MREQSWKVWAVLEGLSKMTSGLFQKFVGLAMKSAETGLIASLLIGAIQAVSGFAGFANACRNNPEKVSLLVPDIRSITWAIVFGFIATVISVIGIYTFLIGADLGVRTLLVVCSIIPGAILGAIIFPETDKLNVRQVSGIGFFLLAVWAMLDFPSISTLGELPNWVWLTLVITLSVAANEILSRKASLKLDTWVNNFWVGSSTVVFSLLGLAIWGMVDSITLEVGRAFWFGVVVLGVIVTAMIAFKLLAYKSGGTIALKKIVMQGTYLITVTFAGMLIHDEPLTFGKMAGLVLFFAAFALTDNSTWNAFVPVRDQNTKTTHTN